MHRTWRSKELHCQSNKYQAASEAGELEVFASPRPLSSLLHTLWMRSLRQFEFLKCKNVAITAICIRLFFLMYFLIEKPGKLRLRACVQNTSGNLAFARRPFWQYINSGHRFFWVRPPPFYTRPARFTDT